MVIKKHQGNLVSTGTSAEIMTKKSINPLDEKIIIDAMQSDYAETQVNLTNLTDEEKQLKLNKAQRVIEKMADSLGAQGLLQNMLVTQLLATHDLQQRLLPYVTGSMHDPEHGQYYINAITKLSNVFIQQVNTLHKLQGNSQQKVTVEHLHINDGGNAIIGQVNARSMREGGVNGK